MADLTQDSYTLGSNPTDTYNFTFPYNKKSEIKASINATVTTDFTLPTATSIQFNTATASTLAAGDKIKIYRDTDLSSLTATFYAGSAIKSEDLNDNFTQNLHATQEVTERYLSNLGGTMVGDLTLAEDVSITFEGATDNDFETTLTAADPGQDNTITLPNVSGTVITTGDTHTVANDMLADSKLRELATMTSGTAGALADLSQEEVELLDGITVTGGNAVTTAQINKLGGFTGTTANLNIVSGKTFKASDAIDTSSETEIPSSNVIGTYVTNSISAVGGFEAITNKNNFPTAIPVAGVIVSIADASDITVNSSGVATITNGAGSNTVTINNFTTSLRGGNGDNADPFQLPNNTGLLVTSTGSSHTYNFHRLLPTTDDVKQLSDDVNDFFARYRVESSAPSSSNDDGDLYWDTSTNLATGRKLKVYDSKYANGDGTTGAWIDIVTTGETFVQDKTDFTASSNTGGNTTGNFDGTAYRFTLSSSGPTGLKASQYIVSKSGTIQKPDNGTYGTGESGIPDKPSTGYAINGSDIIFAAAPGQNDSCFVVSVGSALTIGTPSDDTVSTDKIVDDNVTYSKIQNVATANRVLGSSSADGVVSEVQVTDDMIADDTISEVKLDISNAPTASDDNKVLKYRNDGTNPSYMEWGDPNPEGTVVKSTTNSNEVNTKFLRADGDGTCSWQTPDGPTVTATASGDIAAGRSVVLNIDGTVSQIKAAVSGGSLSSSVTVVAAADRSNSDDHYSNNYTIVYDPDAEKVIFFWRELGGTGSTDSIKYKVGTIDSSTYAITVSSEHTAVSGVPLNPAGHFEVCYNTNTNKYVLAYTRPVGAGQSTEYLWFQGGSWNSNDNDIDWSTAETILGITNGNSTPDQNERCYTTSNEIFFKLAADPDSGRVAAIYLETDSATYAIAVMTNSSDNTITIGGRAGMEGNDVGLPLDLAYDPDQDKFIGAYATKKLNSVNDNHHPAVNYLEFDSNNDCTTNSELDTFSTSHEMRYQMKLAYNEDEDRWLAAWLAASGNNNEPGEPEAKFFTFNGSSFGDLSGAAPNSISLVENDRGKSTSGKDHSTLIYHPFEKFWLYFFEDGGTTGQYPYYRWMGWDQKRTPYQSSYDVDTYSQGSTGNVNEGMRKGVPITDTDGKLAQAGGLSRIATLIFDRDTDALKAQIVKLPGASNFNNIYLGISTAQCNDGDTATIAVSGNVVTTDRTDLDIRRTYHLHPHDGDVTTSTSNSTTSGLDYISDIGFAVSNTDILLN